MFKKKIYKNPDVYLDHKNQAHCYYRSFYANGVIFEEGQYFHGLQIGVWKRYNPENNRCSSIRTHKKEGKFDFYNGINVVLNNFIC